MSDYLSVKNLLCGIGGLWAAFLLVACQPIVDPTTILTPTALEIMPICSTAGLAAKDIFISGSSTVEPLTQRIAALFAQQGFKGTILIDGPGTGAGFRLFCQDGTEDIVNASRPVTAAEKQQCQSIGRELVEFPVGIDALPVMVSARNNFVTALTLDELRKIFSDENMEGRLWSDIKAEWQDTPIKRVIPDEQSGTFDFFVEKIFDGDPTALLAARNKFAGADDQDLANVLSQDPYAIGFFGYGFYQANQPSLKLVKLAFDEKAPVLPAPATVSDGTYPLLRPLFLYSSLSIIHTRPEVQAFLGCYLRQVNDEIEKVGYFPLEAAALHESFQTFADVSK